MKSFWALIIALGLMLPVSIVMVFVTMAHSPRPHVRPVSRKAPLPCACGNCGRTK